MSKLRQSLRSPILFAPMLLAASLISGCGPKVALSPEFAKGNSPYVAFLPTDAPGTIQRERVEYLRELIKIELAERGYLLLDDEITQQVCPQSKCRIDPEFAKRYGIAGTFSLTLDSISKINFLAGYYHALTGSLRFADIEGNVLYDATHTESQRGGVVFESGQVIQGIINQARSGDESSIDGLSLRFVNSLTNGLPGRAQPAAAEDVVVKTVELRDFQGENTELCAWGTPQRMAWLVSNGDSKAQLREISDGKYCGVFRLQGPWALAKGLQVELRSAFGRASRIKVDPNAVRLGRGAERAVQSARSNVTGL